MSKSRILVKNIPKHLKEDRLKQIFSAKGEITDVKILRTKDGRSRQFAFVGFKSEQDAKSALLYFNNTYIDTSKIIVEYAKPFTDPDARKNSWSKYTPGTSAYTRIQRAQGKMQKGKKPDRPEASPKANASDTNTEKDRDKEAFMQLMKPRRQKQLWANDDVVASVAVETVTQPKKKGKSTEAKRKPAAEATGKAEVKKRKREDLGGLIEEQRVESVPSRKPGGQGILLKKTHIRFIEDEDEEEEQRGEEAHEQKKQPELPAVHPTALSDLDYMRSKMSASFPDNEEDDDDEEDEEQEEEDEEGEEGEEEESKEQNGNGQSDDHDESGEDAEAMEIERTTDSDEEEAPKANKRKRNSEEEEEEEEEEEGTGEEETGEEESEEQGDGEKGEGKDREEAVADEEEEAAASGRLFVRNLPYTVSEEELKALFSRYGRLAEVRLPQEAGGRTRGYAFVTYLKPQDAARALQALDASIFQGRLIHLLPAKPPPAAKLAEGRGVAGRTEFQRQKEAKKRQVSSQEEAWNALFLRTDTVLEATAARHGLAKGELLDVRDPGSLAVRAALSETAIIQETKRVLEREGVDLDQLAQAAMGGKLERSDTTMLVKNLPYETTEEELRTLFEAYGTLGRLVLTPSRALALVEFIEVSPARAAFRALNYSRFHHLPLYLEWAPAGIFRTAFDPSRRKAEKDKKQKKSKAAAAGEKEEAEKGDAEGAEDRAGAPAEEAEEEEADGQARTLFVKNLNFATTEESLRKHFEAVAAVRSATIVKKRGAKEGAQSMGYGFVEFANHEDALRALKQLQGEKLDGHALALKFSQRATKDSQRIRARRVDEEHKPCRKLLVKNVPFEATKKELMELFSTYGKVQKVRLPAKAGGGHRGFAFVEFLTKQEAQAAREALSSTHLYGRHLIIQYAAEDKSLATAAAVSHVGSVSTSFEDNADFIPL